MTTSDLFETAFAEVPLLAILRGFDADRTRELTHAAWDAGIPLVEVPVQSDDAIAALAALAREGGDAHAVGAGTVTSVDLVRRSSEAGAAFTVAPGFDPEVLAASLDAGMPHLPGVATATEVQRALAAGCTWLKAFPAAELGASWLGAMHGPFPAARFVCTGGMGLGNAAEFLDAGASAVALGSALADPSAAASLADLVGAVRRS